MGILLSALAAAGDAGVQSENQNIQQQNALDQNEQTSNLAFQKQRALLEIQKQDAIDAETRKRQGMADRVGAASQTIAQKQIGQQYAPSDVAVAAANSGQTDSQLTPEQLSTIRQAKAADTAKIVADQHTYIAAATQTGDIDPHAVAQLQMQEDSIKRQEAAQAAQFAQSDKTQRESFAHADASQLAGQMFQARMQQNQIAATAALTQKRLDANATDPEAIKSMAQLVADGDATLGKRDPDRSEILAAVKKINPDYNEGDSAASYHAKQAFATGKQGDSVRFANNALEHLNTLKLMATYLNNKDMPAYNKVANFLAQQTGDPSVTNFDVARNLVGQEVVKAIVPGAGGEKERETAADAFKRSGAPAQILGAANTYTSLLATQMRGLQQQYVASNPVYVAHPERSDFARYLGAGTRAITGIKPPSGKPDNWGLAAGAATPEITPANSGQQPPSNTHKPSLDSIFGSQ